MTKITIDAGHGYNVNHSPVVDEYYEGTQMWCLGNMLANELMAYGFDVVLTRENITDDPGIYARGETAGKNGSDVFISLHSNAVGKSSDGTYDQSITGTTVYRSLTNDNSQELGEQLGNAVAEIMGHKFRGCKTKKYSDSKPTTDYYGVIRGAAENGCTTAFIVEHGFHTNKADAEFLLDEDNLAKIAKSEAQVIADYYGIAKPVVEECNCKDEIAMLKTTVEELRQKVDALEKIVNNGSMVINGTIAYKTID